MVYIKQQFSSKKELMSVAMQWGVYFQTEPDWEARLLAVAPAETGQHISPAPLAARPMGAHSRSRPAFHTVRTSTAPAFRADRSWAEGGQAHSPPWPALPSWAEPARGFPCITSDSHSAVTSKMDSPTSRAWRRASLLLLNDACTTPLAGPDVYGKWLTAG